MVRRGKARQGTRPPFYRLSGALKTMDSIYHECNVWKWCKIIRTSLSSNELSDVQVSGCLGAAGCWCLKVLERC
jgi:hypothetical protein